MSDALRIALAQVDFTVGAVLRNADRVRAALAEARAQGAQLVVFPELALTGYPPEDLLDHGGLLRQVESALAALAAEAQRHRARDRPSPARRRAPLQLRLAARRRPGPARPTASSCCPTTACSTRSAGSPPATPPCVVEVAGVRVGITICEDIWWPGPAAQAAAAGAELIVNLSASPYEQGKPARREAVFAARVAEARVPLGAASTWSAVRTNCCSTARRWCSTRPVGRCCACRSAPRRSPPSGSSAAPTVGSRPQASAPHGALLGAEASVYGALRLGIGDYARKNGFKGVVLGLSGGVDSALTLALAADALGGDAVTALMLHSRHTAELSLRGASAAGRDARGRVPQRDDRARVRGVRRFVGAAVRDARASAGDVTEQNLQARCRGVMLMAVSNRMGRLLLTTGNKSELAVGYATLYGDMAGGYAPLRDVYKTLVWRLSRWRNRDGEVIPREVIERAPSAELAPGQTDQDSLPPYEVLDAILEAFVEDDLAVADIVARGHDRATVERVVRMVQRAEFKRRQAAPGPMVSRRAFGRDRRYPVTSGYDPAARLIS